MNLNPELIRLSIFFAVFMLCALWEWSCPRKTLTQSKATRWLNNLGLVGLNSVCLSLLMPVLAIEAAYWAQQDSIGLFNWVDLPQVAEIALSVIILDGVIYAQHVLFTSLLGYGVYIACTTLIKILM